jgi:hypothetical protein
MNSLTVCSITLIKALFIGIDIGAIFVAKYYFKSNIIISL